MLVDEQPSDAVIQWAAEELPTIIKHPYDRPWFKKTKTPDKELPNIIIDCRCKDVVSCKHYNCEGNDGCIYVGQCLNCETIIWAYKDRAPELIA